MLPGDDPVLSAPHPPHLVRCEAGDAVLWDSRTVHCNTPPLLAPRGGGEHAGSPAGEKSTSRRASDAHERGPARASEERSGEGGGEGGGDGGGECGGGDGASTPPEPEPEPEAEADPRPGRLVAYASFAPRSRASDSVLAQRQRAFELGQTCTHWPFELTCLEPPRAMGEAPSDQLLDPGELHRRLVGYTV